MAEWIANAEIFAAIVVAFSGALMTIVSLLAFARLRSTRALLVGMGFVGILAKGVFLIYAALASRGQDPWVLPAAILDLWIVAAFYLALRKA